MSMNTIKRLAAAPIDFDARMLEQAASGLRRLEELASDIDSTHNDQFLERAVEATRRKIQAHLADDFNIPRAVAAPFDFVREANASARPGERTAELLSELNSLFDFLPSSISLDRELLALIQQCEQYRASSDYAEAEALREQLLAKGVQLYDTPEGVRWRRITSPAGHVPAPDRPPGAAATGHLGHPADRAAHTTAQGHARGHSLAMPARGRDSCKTRPPHANASSWYRRFPSKLGKTGSVSFSRNSRG